MAEEQKIKAYCLKCKKQITVSNAETKETTNHRQRIAGQCPDCSKNVSQFIKSSVALPNEANPESAKLLAESAAAVAEKALKTV